MAIINKTTGQPFAPEEPIQLQDVSGVVKAYPAEQADLMLKDPSGGFRVATEQQAQDYKDYVTYGTPTEKVKTFIEAAADTATAGILPAIIDTALENANPVEANVYKENRAKRSEQNYYTNFMGGGVGFFVPGGAAEQAGKIATGLTGLGEKTFAGALARTMQKTALAAGTGAIYGATSEIAPNIIRNHPLSADAIFEHTGKDALGFALPTFALSSSLEALSSIYQMKSDAAKMFRKGAGSLGANVENPVTIKSIKTEDLPRSQTPVSKGTTFKVQTVPETEGIPEQKIYTHRDGNDVVKINNQNLSGNGIDLDTKTGLQDVGQKTNIKDLDSKFGASKQLGENPINTLKRLKIIQEKESFLYKNSFLLTLEEQAILTEHQSLLDGIVKNPNDPTLIESYGKSQQKIENLADDIASKTPLEEQKLYETKVNNVEKNVNGIMKNVDHVTVDGMLHVLNPEAISGELTKVTGEPLTAESKQALEKINVKKKAYEKTRPGFVNTAADYINDLFPKSPEEIPQGQHEIDFIANKNTANLQKYGTDIENILTVIENKLEKSGINTRITTNDLANILENQHLDKYLNPKTGEPFPEFKKEYEEIKTYAKDLRDSGKIETKFGTEYPKLDFGELRAQRLRLDKIANYGSGSPIGMQEAAEALRGVIENHAVETLGKNSPELKNSYSEAKKNYHMAKTAQTLIDGASFRSVQKGTGGVLKRLLGAKIGHVIGGPAGAAIGAIVSGENYGIFGRMSEAASIQLKESLSAAVEKHQSLISKAAAGILANRPNQYPQFKENKIYSYDKLKKDKKNLELSKNNQANYFNDFMSRNNAAFTVLPEAMNGFVQTAIKANDFLLSKVPKNPYENIPWRADKWEPSQMEIDKFNRYKEAVEKPSIILNQLKDGYVTPEATEVLTMIYPQTKEALKNEIISSLKKDIPAEKRVTLFKVFGMPLDSFSTPALFSQMQGNAAMMIQQEAQQNNMGQPINVAKLSDQKQNSTIGTQTIMNKD